jgi:hypothetical protein
MREEVIVPGQRLPMWNRDSLGVARASVHQVRDHLLLDLFLLGGVRPLLHPVRGINSRRAGRTARFVGSG